MEIGNRWKFLARMCENDIVLIIYGSDKDVYCGVYLHWRD